MPINSNFTQEKFKISDVPDASKVVKGIVQLSNELTSESETLAATPKALKEAHTIIQNVSSLIIKSIVTVIGWNGTTFTITNGRETVSGTIGENCSITVELTWLGDYTASYTYDGTNMSKTYTIDSIDSYTFALFQSISFNDDNYETISILSKAGYASSVYAIGDTKAVTLNGSLGNDLTLSNYIAYMQILSFDHNKDVEMNGESHIVCGFGKSALSGGVDVCFVDSTYDTDQSSQYLNMNTSNTTVGGWKSSTMRTVICPAFQSALPSDLQAVLRSRTLYTDNTGNANKHSFSAVTLTTDTVYIPSEFEVQGFMSQSNDYEQNYQQQLTYYKNGNSKIRYKHNDTRAVSYWRLRSAHPGNSTRFCTVNIDGSAGSWNAYSSGGFVPLITI